MEPNYFLFDEKSRKYFPLKDGALCGRVAEGELRFPEDESISATHCQFRVQHGDVYVVSLSPDGLTRVGGAALAWGAPQKLEINAELLLGARRFVLTNRCMLGPAQTLDTSQTIRRPPALGQPPALPPPDIEEIEIDLGSIMRANEENTLVNAPPAEPTRTITKSITNTLGMLCDPHAYQSIWMKMSAATAGEVGGTGAPEDGISLVNDLRPPSPPMGKPTHASPEALAMAGILPPGASLRLISSISGGSSAGGNEEHFRDSVVWLALGVMIGIATGVMLLWTQAHYGLRLR